jgi:hypothetical protein
MSHFQSPTPEAFADIVCDHNLDELQAHELGLVLYHVDEDLKAHSNSLRKSKPRPELVRRLKRIAKILSDLEYEMRRYEKTLNDFLPADAREEIGVLMSFSGMESALNTEIRTRELRSEIESLSSEDAAFRMSQLEDRLLHRRQARGLESGGRLLLHVVERVNRPIKAWLELDRRNRGGRPTKNLARDLLLFRLAEAAPDVVGRKPTATAGGPFVRLCSAVAVACGLEDRGIERAAEKAIKRLCEHRRKGFRRGPGPTSSATKARSSKK